MVPPRNGLDGGMNPVFATKLRQPQTNTTITARLMQVAGKAKAPGALPHMPNPPRQR